MSIFYPSLSQYNPLLGPFCFASYFFVSSLCFSSSPSQSLNVEFIPGIPIYQLVPICGGVTDLFLLWLQTNMLEVSLICQSHLKKNMSKIKFSIYLDSFNCFSSRIPQPREWKRPLPTSVNGDPKIISDNYYSNSSFQVQC